MSCFKEQQQGETYCVTFFLLSYLSSVCRWYLIELTLNLIIYLVRGLLARAHKQNFFFFLQYPLSCTMYLTRNNLRYRINICLNYEIENNNCNISRFWFKKLYEKSLVRQITRITVV